MRELRVARQPADKALLRTGAPAAEPNVTGPTIVYDADSGEPVFVVTRREDGGALRRAVLRYPPTTTYRMAGSRNISRTFGFTTARAPMRRTSCRPCSGATDAEAAHMMITRTAARLADALGAIVPERQAADEELAGHAIRPEWHIAGTQWTSGVVNFSSPMQYHYDANNLRTWSAMPIVRRGTRGGHLHVPEYGLVVECRDGDVCYFAGWDLMHGVTPITKTHRDGYRITAVYYTVAGMRECEAPEAELRAGQRRQSEREDNMRARQEAAGLL